MTAQTQQHTPGPWVAQRARPHGTDQTIGIYRNENCGLHPIAEVAGGQWGEANAAFIVRACNAYDDLLDALAKAEAALANSDPSMKHYAEPVERHATALSAVRAAIAKATGAQE